MFPRDGSPREVKTELWSGSNLALDPPKKLHRLASICAVSILAMRVGALVIKEPLFLLWTTKEGLLLIVIEGITHSATENHLHSC